MSAECYTLAYTIMLKSQDIEIDSKKHITLLLEWNRNSQMKLYISENISWEKPELLLYCIYSDGKTNRSCNSCLQALDRISGQKNPSENRHSVASLKGQVGVLWSFNKVGWSNHDKKTLPQTRQSRPFSWAACSLTQVPHWLGNQLMN